MSYTTTISNRPPLRTAPAPSNLLQRKCACGTHTGAGASCRQCARENTGLIVSNPGDAMEVEADRMADYVVGAGAALPVTSAAPASVVQRQADDEFAAQEQDDSELEQEQEQAVRPEISADSETIGDASGRPKLAAHAKHQSGGQHVEIPRVGGQQLGNGIRSLMESRFVHDFSAVRVHTDDAATRSAQQLQAHAYTVGHDIYFNQNNYQPDNAAGRRLLAHELTHVVQQTASAQLALQRKPKAGFKRPKGPQDPPAGKPKGRKRADTKPPCAAGACDNKVASPVEKEIRHPWCGNEKCDPGPAAKADDFIRHIDVNLKTQDVTAEVGTAKATVSRKVMLSSPNPATTPKGPHTIGTKCGPCHTNMHAHGMGWFTSFHNGLEFGFHNSQKVAKGTHSLACVRTRSGDAKWIHDNTASGVTTVCVHSGSHSECASKKAAPKPVSGGSPAPAQPAPPLVSAATPPGDEGSVDGTPA
jgi:hypothetical protein